MAITRGDFEIVKIYVTGDEDTGIEPGYEDDVMGVKGTLQGAKQVLIQQFSGEVYPGQVHCELRDQVTGKVYARLTGRRGA